MSITFIKELVHRIRAETGEARYQQFLMQGYVVAVQWGNAAAVRGASASLDNVFIHILGRDVPEMLQLLTRKLDVVLAMIEHS